MSKGNAKEIKVTQIKSGFGRLRSHRDCLRGLGLRPGQKVALQLPNVPQFVLAYFGILKAGLVAVPLNPLLRAPEIAQHLTGSDAAVLVTLDAVAADAVAGVEEAGGMPVYAVGPPGAEPPPGTRVAHKTGDITAVNHDAGIVYPRNGPPYVLVVLTHGIEDQKASSRLIADLSLMVYRHATGEASPVEQRSGRGP